MSKLLPISSGSPIFDKLSSLSSNIPVFIFPLIEFSFDNRSSLFAAQILLISFVIAPHAFLLPLISTCLLNKLNFLLIEEKEIY